MSISSDYSTVFENMLNYEKKLHLIYNMLAIKFLEHKDFWRDIASDENTHALMLESFISSYNKDKESFAKNRNFHFEEIEKNLSMANDFLDELQSGDISLEHAMKFALEAESSLVERDIFTCHDNDPDELKRIFKVLYGQSVEHYTKIQETYVRLIGK